MSIVVGTPIYPTGREAGERVKRSEVRRLSAELQRSIQGLFDTAQHRVGL
jgi:hypothetical protein